MLDLTAGTKPPSMEKIPSFKSLVWTFSSQPKLFEHCNGLPGLRIQLEGEITRPPFCSAPWCACADILSADGEFVGFTYPVHEDHEFAMQLAKHANSELVRYVQKESEYAVSLYEDDRCDWFEILTSKTTPTHFDSVLSIDGFWYLDENCSRLLAFGISDLDELLLEYDLKFSQKIDLPVFNSFHE